MERDFTSVSVRDDEKQVVNNESFLVNIAKTNVKTNEVIDYAYQSIGNVLKPNETPDSIIPSLIGDYA